MNVYPRDVITMELSRRRGAGLEREPAAAAAWRLAELQEAGLDKKSYTREEFERACAIMRVPPVPDRACIAVTEEALTRQLHGGGVISAVGGLAGDDTARKQLAQPSWLSGPRTATISLMEVSIPAGTQPALPQPERTPAAIRDAVASLDPAALARFEDDWAATMTRAREEYSVLPVRQFVEHWWMWVAVARWPGLAARLRECEQIVAGSEDRAARRAASAEIGAILDTAAQAA